MAGYDVTCSRACVRYTGVMIENYEDETDGEIVKQTDTQRFQYFGNMILHQGGELGYHGYNHQPLSLSNVDYGDVLPYKTWISMKAMQDALGELIRFGKEMFPEQSCRCMYHLQMIHLRRRKKMLD